MQSSSRRCIQTVLPDTCTAQEFSESMACCSPTFRASALRWPFCLRGIATQKQDKMSSCSKVFEKARQSIWLRSTSDLYSLPETVKGWGVLHWQMSWCVPDCKSMTSTSECNGQIYSGHSYLCLWNHGQEHLSTNTEKSKLCGIWFVSGEYSKLWHFLNFRYFFPMNPLFLLIPSSSLWSVRTPINMPPSFCTRALQMCHQWVHPEDLWFVWTLS